MTNKAMPLVMNSNGQYLELRNADDAEVLPAMQLKSGEDARAAAKRAVEEFFGLPCDDGMVKEGFQARVGNEVVAVFPVDSSKMELNLLRPAESVSTWAWKNVPDSMGDVVALGFPRNLGERRNAADLLTAPDGTRAGAGMVRNNGEAEDQFNILADALAAKIAGLKALPAHERAARAAEADQELEDLRLLAADMGKPLSAERLNADDSGRPITARALIRQNDSTILSARQRDGRSLLPGGHLNDGETPEDAVVRELQEEFGIDIRPGMTGETYDFQGEDGGSHRVFVVDGSKLDLSTLTPGDDVQDAELMNSPFTDSHGQVHPQETHENAQTKTCTRCEGSGVSGDALCPNCFGTGKEFANAQEESENKSGDGRENASIEPGDHVSYTEASGTKSYGKVRSVNGRECEIDWESGSKTARTRMPTSVLRHEERRNSEHRNHIEKLGEGKYRLLSHEGRNLGDFPSHAAAAKHEGEVEWFKENKNAGDSGVYPISSIGALVGTPQDSYWANHSERKYGDTREMQDGRRMTFIGSGQIRVNVDERNGFSKQEHENAADAGDRGHEYTGKMDGPFPVVRCNSIEIVATQEGINVFRCEGCGDVIPGPIQSDVAA